jgi:guanylate kinase
MLVVILGTAGVGKDTVMRYLSRDYGFHLVSTLTSRTERPDDSNKTMSPVQFFPPNKYEVQEAFGNLYAQRKDELISAVESPRYFAVDVSCRYIDRFSIYTNTFVLLTLPTWEEHERRLEQAGRQERIGEVKKETELAERLVDHRLMRIVNEDSKRTAKIIAESLE